MCCLRHDHGLVGACLPRLAMRLGSTFGQYNSTFQTGSTVGFRQLAIVMKQQIGSKCHVCSSAWVLVNGERDILK